ncbi:MAG: hypothetical protein ACTHN5_04145 [Phycisphaerae bacterium]
MVAGRIVEGSPKQIAEQLTLLTGTDRQIKVLLLDDPTTGGAHPIPTEEEVDRMLAEMREDSVSAGQLDLSREGIYDERYR